MLGGFGNQGHCRFLRRTRSGSGSSFLTRSLSRTRSAATSRPAGGRKRTGSRSWRTSRRASGCRSSATRFGCRAAPMPATRFLPGRCGCGCRPPSAPTAGPRDFRSNIPCRALPSMPLSGFARRYAPRPLSSNGAGHPGAHPLGGLQFPKVTDDGFPIIETEELDYGSVWATVADANDQAGDPAEVRRFISQFGHFVRTPFRGSTGWS